MHVLCFNTLLHLINIFVRMSVECLAQDSMFLMSTGSIGFPIVPFSDEHSLKAAGNLLWTFNRNVAMAEHVHVKDWN